MSDSMKINGGKVTGGQTPINVTVDGQTSKEVHSFKYLLARISSNATCAAVIKRRLAVARECTHVCDAEIERSAH